MSRTVLVRLSITALLTACGSTSTQTPIASTESPPEGSAPPGDAETSGSSSGSASSGTTTTGSQTGSSSSSSGGASPRVCDVSETSIECPYDTTTVQLGRRRGREIHFAVPPGDPPRGGWPVALLFQGSFVSGELYLRTEGDKGYDQANVGARLLDEGFAVIAPETANDGALFWDTNRPRWEDNWRAAPDHALMVELFTMIESGTFGELNPSRLFAAGISSGGYMTSRMAVSYPGRFTALAIHSGSYATCSGGNCELPKALPRDHPPTLFMHGDADSVVPAGTSEAYYDRLRADGVDTRRVVEPGGGHSWFRSSAEETVAWFIHAER